MTNKHSEACLIMVEAPSITHGNFIIILNQEQRRNPQTMTNLHFVLANELIATIAVVLSSHRGSSQDDVRIVTGPKLFHFFVRLIIYYGVSSINGSVFLV